MSDTNGKIHKDISMHSQHHEMDKNDRAPPIGKHKHERQDNIPQAKRKEIKTASLFFFLVPFAPYILGRANGFIRS